MLSQTFKKKLKRSLKDNYNIDCYRIVSSEFNAYKRKNFILNCFCNDKRIDLELLINTVDDDFYFDSQTLSFFVFINKEFIDCVPAVSNTLDNPLLHKAIFELNLNALSELFPNKRLGFYHNKPYIISGKYEIKKGLINLSDINSVPESAAHIFMAETFSPTNKILLNLFIIGNEFSITSYFSSKIEPNFVCEKHSVDTDINVFKEVVLKNFLSLVSKDDMLININDFEALTYEELEQYLYILKMQKI